MLTRRTFIQGAGALAAGAVAGGIALQKPEIKEHGLVEIRFWLFDKDPVVIKSTIFSDERRDVFGVRLLGERGPGDLRLAELRLPAVKVVIAAPERVKICTGTMWNEESEKEEMFLNLVARGGNLVIALAGQLDKASVWMSLADVRRVL